MRKLLCFSALSLFLIGCGGSSGPDENELKSRFVGQYCDGHVKLWVNEDGSYKSQQARRGAMSLTPILESCEGKYSFHNNEETGNWEIRFEKSSKNSNPLVSCEGIQVVWKKEGGYVSDSTATVLKDLIQGTDVTKDDCDL